MFQDIKSAMKKFSFIVILQVNFFDGKSNIYPLQTDALHGFKPMDNIIRVSKMKTVFLRKQIKLTNTENNRLNGK